jgi:hypothetical protein
MKKMTLFAIPVFVVMAILGGIFVWKVMTPSNSTQPVTQAKGPLPNAFNQAGGSKPSNAFGGLFIQSTPTPAPIPILTPTPASVGDLNAQLQTVGDDGGASDFTSLNSDASGL